MSRMIAAAYRRDLRDATRIGALMLLVSRWRDELDRTDATLEHPDARWHVCTLRDAIDDTLLDLAGEADRVRGATVVSE